MSKQGSRSLWLAAVLCACAGLYLIGNARVPLWDRDEPWYAQCSWQMLRSGDWVVPRYLDGSLRTEKPPLIYWLQMIPMSVMGPTGAAARGVSAMGIVVLLAVFGLTLRRIAGAGRAAWTVLILGSSALVIAAAKMCLTDAVLLLWITIAQLCIYAIWRGKGGWWAVVGMCVMIALGGLTKGPIALIPPVMTGLALLVFEVVSLDMWTENSGARARMALTLEGGRVRQIWRGRRRWIGRALGVLAVGLICVAAIDGSWLLLVHQRRAGWLEATLTIARRHIGTQMEGHGGPPGTYALWVWGTFFPWSLLLPTTAVMAWRHRHLPLIRFAIAAVLGPWVFQELMTTKLPHYVLPTFPWLALLTADGLVRCIRGQYRDLSRKGFVVAVGIWALPVGLVASAPWLLSDSTWLAIRSCLPGWLLALKRMAWLANYQPMNLGPMPWAAMVALSAVGLAYTFSVFYFVLKRRLAYAGAALGLGFLAVVGVLYAVYLPQADFLHLSERAVEVLRRENAIGDQVQPGEVVTLVYGMNEKTTRDTLGYQEPSLPYYQGGTISQLQAPGYLGVTRAAQWPRLMVLTSEIWDLTPQRIKDQLENVCEPIHGLNYADGDKVIDLRIVRRKRVDSGR